jgi:uncharacterized protein YbaP (TraB family)
MTHRLLLACLCSTLITIPASAANNDLAHSLLWRITTPSGAVSHLFGTIHLSVEPVLEMRDSVTILLSRSSSVWTELDQDETNLAKQTAMQALLLPPGSTLQDFYTPAEFALIERKLDSIFHPDGRFIIPMITRMKPWGVAVMVMMHQVNELQQQGPPPETAITVDQFIWEFARRDSISAHGIETMSEQLTVLETMPPSMLLEMLSDTVNQDSVTNDLIEAYVQEDLTRIAEMMLQLDDLGAFSQAINADRNARMVERLIPSIDRGGAFIAVGAAHLPGEKGLIKRLTERGYKVTPVTGGRRMTGFYERGQGVFDVPGR